MPRHSPLSPRRRRPTAVRLLAAPGAVADASGCPSEPFATTQLRTSRCRRCEPRRAFPPSLHPATAWRTSCAAGRRVRQPAADAAGDSALRAGTDSVVAASAGAGAGAGGAGSGSGAAAPPGCTPAAAVRSSHALASARSCATSTATSSKLSSSDATRRLSSHMRASSCSLLRSGRAASSSMAQQRRQFMSTTTSAREARREWKRQHKRRRRKKFLRNQPLSRRRQPC